jgi:hypothetical protein
MKKTVLGNLLIALVAVLCMDILSSGCGSGSVGDPLSVGVGTGGSVSPTTISLSNGGAAGTSAWANGGSTSSTSPGDTTCGTTTRDTTQAPADILIVLDRSESMTSSLTDDKTCTSSTCTTRLAAVVPAVQAVVTDNPGIHWGLELFSSPGGNSCSVSSTPQVPISADSSAAINAQLAALTTQTSTPTRLAITTATAYLNMVADGNNKAILLASDGLPNCASGAGSSSSGTDDLSGTKVAVKAAKDAGFPVYVIGIGPTTSVSNLNQLAVEGGTGSYYPATSTTELNAALTKIAKAVSTCTFKSDTAPPKGNSSLVYVYVDKNYVAQDDSNGWKFDPTDSTNSTIVLTGSTCTDLMDGKTSQVQIVFGCPGTAPTKVIF